MASLPVPAAPAVSPGAGALFDAADASLPQVRFYGRRRAAGPVPLVVHFHGGAFVSGSLDSGGLVSGLLNAAGAVVISVDYPLAPRHPFPAAVEAGYAVLSWVHRNRRRLGGAASAVFVAGEEAGGNIAAAVALMARDRLGPALAGQILLSPMLDAAMGTASLRSADAGMASCKWADGWHQYLGTACDAGHPYAAPAAVTRLAGLAPALLLTACDDPMRDEGRAYAARLREAGVPVSEAMLSCATGWPDTLSGVAGAPAPWTDDVLKQLFTFLVATPAGSIVRTAEQGAD